MLMVSPLNDDPFFVYWISPAQEPLPTFKHPVSPTGKLTCGATSRASANRCTFCFAPRRVTFCLQRQKVTKKRRPKPVCPSGARVLLTRILLVFPDLSLWQFIGRVVSIRRPGSFRLKSPSLAICPSSIHKSRQTGKGERSKAKADRLSRFVRCQPVYSFVFRLQIFLLSPNAFPHGACRAL